MAAPGQIIDVMDSVADSLIANGYAVLIMRKQEPIIETAALDREVDTAVKPKAIKKKKRCGKWQMRGQKYSLSQKSRLISG